MSNSALLRNGFVNSSRVHPSIHANKQRKWQKRLLARAIPHAMRVTLEVLEGRILLSGMSSDQQFDSLLVAVDTSAYEMPEFAGQSAAAAPAEFSFDIATFTATIPKTLPATNYYDMDGLRFYSNATMSSGPTSNSFGSGSAPAWTLIGLAGDSTDRFLPMLLSYGTTQINFGAGLDNSFSWTNGLYSVWNPPSVDNNLVNGGVAIQNNSGSIYSSSLLNSGTSFALSGISGATVTTSSSFGNKLLPNQPILFSGLQNPNVVENGALYYVDSVVSTTSFTIKSADGKDLSQASATGGTVAPGDTSSGPADDVNWGMLLPTASYMPLMNGALYGSQAPANVSTGFSPTRILFTEAADTGNPIMQFEGTVSVGYKGANFSAALGAQSANQAKYLEITSDGTIQYVDAGTGENEISLQLSLGRASARPFLDVTSLVSGTVTTGAPHGLSDGDYVQFNTEEFTPNPPTNTNTPASPNPLQLHKSYPVKVLSPTSFQLMDETFNVPINNGNGNSGGAMVVETAITSIGDETIEGQTAGVITTASNHGFSVGDVFTFSNLAIESGSLPAGTSSSDTFIVARVIDDTHYTFIADHGVDAYTEISGIVVTQPGSRISDVPFKAGGFSIGGDVNLLLTYDGGFASLTTPNQFNIKLSGTVGASIQLESGLSGSFMAQLQGDSDTSVGLEIDVSNGVLTVPDWGFTLNGSFEKAGVFSLAVSGLSISSITDVTGTETMSVNGSATANIIPWGVAVTANLGHGETNGLTLITNPDGTVWLQELSFQLEVDSLQPTGSSYTQLVGNVHLMSFKGEFSYNSTGPDDQGGVVGIGGQAVMVVGPQTTDQNGNWAPGISTVSVMLSPGVLSFSETGVSFDLSEPGASFELDVNGIFDVKNVNFVAMDLRLVVQRDITDSDLSLTLSGGVRLPQLANATLQLGNNGGSSGLVVNLDTGQWQLQGWRIQLPEIQAAAFSIYNFSLGWSGVGADPADSSNWQLEASGQIKVFAAGGILIGVTLGLGEKNGHFIVTDIGGSIRNLNPGIPIPGFDSFLTDFGFQVDNIPSSITASILFGGTFGDQVTIGNKEYSMAQALVQGTYSGTDIDVVGTLLVVGGLLGSAQGKLDLNWGTHVYSFDGTGSLLYNALEGHLNLVFTPDYETGSFGVKLQVPPEVPIIGGLEVAAGDVLWLTEHVAPNLHFVAAWAEFFGHWKYGFEYDFDTKKFSLIGTKAINGLISDIPSDVTQAAYNYSYQYSTTATAASALPAAGTTSTNSYGLIEVTWAHPSADNQDKIFVNGGGSTLQVWGPGTSAGWVLDTQAGLAYQVLPDQSVAGDVFIHVVPLASITGDNTADDPDLYELLPNTSVNVVLTSSVNQSLDPSTSWTGSYGAPAPELGFGETPLVQQTSQTALGASNGSDPIVENNATINFDYRTVDPDATSVDFYYDYVGHGYNGVKFLTVNVDDLNGTPLDESWFSASVPWDLGGLPAKETYVYMVIRDPDHVPVISQYIGSVLPAVQTYFQTTVNSILIAPSKMAGWNLTVTPVTANTITGISNGSATVSGPVNLSPGDRFMFDGLNLSNSVTAIASGTVYYSGTLPLQSGDRFTFQGLSALTDMANDTPYYIVDIDTTTQTFTFAATLSGEPIATAQATPGDTGIITPSLGVQNGTPYFVLDVTGNSFTFSGTPGGTPVSTGTISGGTAYVDSGDPLYFVTDTNGSVNPYVALGTYRYELGSPLPLFSPSPGANTGQTISYKNEMLQYVTVQDNTRVMVNFNYQVNPGIYGSVYRDLTANNAYNASDPGAAGVTVYIDANNNGQLDSGEDSQVTNADGAYYFPLAFTSTANVNVRIVTPAGWLSEQSPALPVQLDLSNINTLLTSYNFLIVEPVTLSGTVYLDGNTNGKKDPGESGLSGVGFTVIGPDGSHSVVTNSDGVWTFISPLRGEYSATVAAPSGATFTTPTSLNLTVGDLVTRSLIGDIPVDLDLTDLVTSYDPLTNSYNSWITAYTSQQTDGSFATFTNVAGTSKATEATVVGKALRSQNLVGYWEPNGSRSLFSAVYSIEANGLPAMSLFMIPSSSPASVTSFNTTSDPSQVFALSYSTDVPDYSALVSIDGQGNFWLWEFDSSGGTLVRSATPVFSLPNGLGSSTILKAAGFSLASNDPLRRQDIAYVTQANSGGMRVSIWNHATQQISSYSLNGDQFADLVAGDFNNDGREDIAALTADSESGSYYLTVLLSQVGGSMEKLFFTGGQIAIDGTGNPATNLAVMTLAHGRQGLLWTTQNASGSQTYLNVASLENDEITVGTLNSSYAGTVAVRSSGDVGTAGALTVFSSTLPDKRTAQGQNGTVTYIAGGSFNVASSLTQYGGVFGGFDAGLAGIAAPASSTTSGIVFSDVNSNGVMDPGESPLAGYTVRLITPTGEILTTVTSDGTDGNSLGSYSFQNVPAGSHIGVLLNASDWLSQNTPHGVDTLATPVAGLNTSIAFSGGIPLTAIPAATSNDDDDHVRVRSGDLQNTGRDNAVIRTSSMLWVELFDSNGASHFSQLPVSSPAGAQRPELRLADINGDGRLDIVTAGAGGVDVLINLGMGEFANPVTLLADKLYGKATSQFSASQFTGDADSGVSASKTYTHALNFYGSPVTVNGVQFAAAATTGTNYTLQSLDPATNTPGPMNNYGNNVNNLTGNFNTLAQTFFYGTSTGVEQLTLTGLTPGITYTATFYGVGFGNGQRVQTITDSQGGAFANIDEDYFGNGNGIVIRDTFVASSASITFTFTGVDPSATFHQYAFTNEVAAVQQNTWNTALAVINGENGQPDLILAARQGTGTVYEIGWNAATGQPAATGQLWNTGTLIRRLAAGDVTGDGNTDLVVYENTAASPQSPGIEKVWLLNGATNFGSATKAMILGYGTFNLDPDLAVAQLFPSEQTILFLGDSALVTYRPTNGILTTPIPAGPTSPFLDVGNYAATGAGSPKVLVSNGQVIFVLTAGTDSSDTSDPNGNDPSVPMVIAGQTSASNSVYASAAWIADGTSDVKVVEYDNVTQQFTVVPQYNIENSYLMPANPGGAVFDFAVITAGTAGGTIQGNVFYDVDNSGMYTPGDYGMSDGLTVFLDLDNDGALDNSDPRVTTDAAGNFTFTQLTGGVYTIVALVPPGLKFTTVSSYTITLSDLPSAASYGNDFGVISGVAESDFNSDGKSDLLLTDPATGKVHVQLRNGANRYATYHIGMLPSADWSVAGVSDFTGNGTPDVLIYNTVSGAVRLWDVRTGNGVPSIDHTVGLPYVVPVGWRIVSTGDLNHNGKQELLLLKKSTGEHRIVEFARDTSFTDKALTVPRHTLAVGIGDLDGDGFDDLLVRNTQTGNLIAALQGNSPRQVNIGKPPAGWLVAGVVGITNKGISSGNIVFENPATGNGYVWQLNANGSLADTVDLKIGQHNGLRLHLAEQPLQTASILGRSIFYNSSAFDGNNFAINANDDAAIATDKQALFSGQTATFANYTSYYKGINGIMIDVANMATVQLSAADFVFRVGNSPDAVAWLTAPMPANIVVRPGAGINGSDRVEIVWSAGSIVGKWLQIILKADANTSLTQDDVFYFGNAIGESGNSSTDAAVTAADVQATRSHISSAPVTISSPWDYNRDGFITTLDVNLARKNLTSAKTALKLISTPAFRDLLAPNRPPSPGQQTRAYLEFVVVPGSLKAGQKATIIVYAKDAQGRLILSDHSYLTLKIKQGPAGGKIYGALSIRLKNGMAVFRNLHFEKAGNYILQVSGRIGSAISSPFSVAPGAPSDIRGTWSTKWPPINSSFFLRIEVVDQFGNRVPDSTTNVSLYLRRKPRNATLTYPATVQMSGGLASIELLADRRGHFELIVSYEGTLLKKLSREFDVR